MPDTRWSVYETGGIRRVPPGIEGSFADCSCGSIESKAISLPRESIARMRVDCLSSLSLSWELIKNLEVPPINQRHSMRLTAS